MKSFFKSALALLIVFIIICSAVACVNFTENPTDEPTVSETEAPPTETESESETETQTETETETRKPAEPSTAVESGNTAADDGVWNLLLVNPWNKIPEGHSVALARIDGGYSIDKRCYSSFQAMMNACRAAGNSPVVCSAYRTQKKQESLYYGRVNNLIAQGYSEEDAKREAGKITAVPGTSEHQLGLAVDIVDRNNQHLNESQENTPVQKWLMEHSWEYGFILRYPKSKSAVTGIIYEPWHYRYVGKEAAKEIYEQGVCLEEYPEAKITADESA